MTATEVDVVDQSAGAAIQNVKRAREIYRYIQPEDLLAGKPESHATSIHEVGVPSLSAVLSPFCQLAALRCNARKAMLSVMDRDVMYFLAEAYRAPVNNNHAPAVSEFVEDPILMACTSAPLKGRICELTLALDPDSNKTSFFVIDDLTESDFAELFVVAGEPHYRFYAGTPIRSRGGINIGSLSVMDTKVRNGLTQPEEECLGNLAAQIMAHLETNRQAIEGSRARRMAEGLEGFIAGKKSLLDPDVSRVPARKAKSGYGLPMGLHAHPSADEQEKPSIPRHIRAKASLDSLDSDTATSEQTTDTEPYLRDEDMESRSHPKTFARAANLLRESFGDLGEDGGVVFMTLKNRLEKPKKIVSLPHPSHGAVLKPPSVDQDAQPSPAQAAPILAKSSQTVPFMTDDEDVKPSSMLTDDMLREIMQRHPGGRIFPLDDTGRLSSSEEDSKNRAPGRTRKSSRRKRNEIKALRRAFPQAKQILFAPVWDSSIGSFAHAVFVTTSLLVRSFSPTLELPFINSFCSTVMAECSRLDAMKADRQKSDFVGVISHELRSPLHGILASVEFLADTELSSFQNSLKDTIESCGRTLLDTINHVLDFSKINSFQKQWQASNKRTKYLGSRKRHYLGPESASKSFTHGAPPLLQLFGLVDVAAVVEEVVDGLVLGYSFTSGIDRADRLDENQACNGKGSLTAHDNVQVLLDIQHVPWDYVTQPGAVRRVALNLVGNALKYTERGTIKVRLELKDAPSQETDTDTMLLTVADTGRGISQDFLTSKLFVPFAQENSLAPGTGLGLSITHSIVTMLGGTIDVNSEVGTGTKFVVTLPLRRPLPGQHSTSAPLQSGSTEASSAFSGPDESLTILQAQAAHSRIAFYSASNEMNAEMRILARYVEEWYGLDVVSQSLIESSQAVILSEHDLDRLVNKAVGTPGSRPALIVLCSVASRHSASYIADLESRIGGAVEFLSHPVGPRKLARSLDHALRKTGVVSDPVFGSLAAGDTGSNAVEPALGGHSADIDGVTDSLREMQLQSPTPDGQGPMVQATETLAALQTSQNAQMAITSAAGGLKTPRGLHESAEFPFPDQATEETEEQEDTPNATATPTRHASSNRVPARRRSRRDSAVPATPSGGISPRILLVDDNKINLDLLETFLRKKRRYEVVHKAEDGRQAVEAFTSATELYDIVFMDISMPVMDGFEATRAIREYEESRQHSATPDHGALIIALTGLASGKDQSEGFDSGVDIYLTKPVSFKNVSTLLDNWTSHRNLKDPHAQDGESMASGMVTGV